MAESHLAYFVFWLSWTSFCAICLFLCNILNPLPIPNCLNGSFSIFEFLFSYGVHKLPRNLPPSPSISCSQPVQIPSLVVVVVFEGRHLHLPPPPPNTYIHCCGASGDFVVLLRVLLLRPPRHPKSRAAQQNDRTAELATINQSPLHNRRHPSAPRANGVTVIGGGRGGMGTDGEGRKKKKNVDEDG